MEAFCICPLTSFMDAILLFSFDLKFANTSFQYHMNLKKKKRKVKRTTASIRDKKKKYRKILQR